MEQRMTWNKIQEKFPNQWVGMSDVHYETDGANIESAVVKYSNLSQSELGIKMLKGEIVSRYTTPDTCSLPLGFVGAFL